MLFIQSTNHVHKFSVICKTMVWRWLEDTERKILHRDDVAVEPTTHRSPHGTFTTKIADLPDTEYSTSCIIGKIKLTMRKPHKSHC